MVAENKYTLKIGSPEGGAEAVKRLLAQTYWAPERPLESIARSIENSRCYCVYHSGELVGFARVISDFATTFYVCDVIVDEAHRSRGIGKMLLGAISDDPDYKGLLGVLLTRDAHGLYEQYGFERDEKCAMRRKRG